MTVRVPHFSVEFHTHGNLRKRFEVRANVCRGLDYVPDFESVCREIPARYWAALQRGGWWREAHAPSLPARCDLHDKAGKLIGTLFATQLETSSVIGW